MGEIFVNMLEILLKSCTEDIFLSSSKPTARARFGVFLFSRFSTTQKVRTIYALVVEKVEFA
jgi:hypothetical protein